MPTHDEGGMSRAKPSRCNGWAWGRILFLTLLSCASPHAARADDQPFDGKWKVLIPQQHYEIAMWIVHVDIPGKQARLLSGLGVYDESVISDVKVRPETLSMRLTILRVAGRLIPGSFSEVTTIESSASFGRNSPPSCVS